MCIYDLLESEWRVAMKCGLAWRRGFPLKVSLVAEAERDHGLEGISV